MPKISSSTTIWLLNEYGQAVSTTPFAGDYTSTHWCRSLKRARTIAQVRISVLRAIEYLQEHDLRDIADKLGRLIPYLDQALDPDPKKKHRPNIVGLQIVVERSLLPDVL